MAIGERDPRRNKLLRSLTTEQYARLERHLQIVAIAARQPAYMASEPLTTAYFPLTGVFALVTLLQSGETLAIGTIGNEGFVGHAIPLGGDRMPFHVVCKVAATCAAIRADILREQLRADAALHALLLRNTQALFNQVALVAACNRVHLIEQRLSRCLLVMHDRSGLEEFPLTHEFLAEILGVRRATITEAANSLQQKGLIGHARGRVRILNRPALEAGACVCYRAMQQEYEQEVLAA
jgi:CRP-like cAMP-binding protein